MVVSMSISLILALLGLANAYAVTRPQVEVDRFNVSASSPLLVERASNDPADFSWIKRWAAIGDSFTAGIGSGSPLGSFFYQRKDYWCSRYDRSYPMVLNRAFGSAVDSFQFPACSGDRTGGIYDQANNLQGDLNLVIMTAGGNDLCLATMIKRCIFMPYSENECQAVIDKAQENIETILKPNLKQILEALNDKMADDGIVVFNGYAQYFNTESEDCATKQDWSMYVFTWKSGLPLTLDHRKKFNNLVTGINNAIKSVVEEAAADSAIKYRIGFSNWDIWPSEGVSGQYCDPSSTNVYPDPQQPDLQFFKPDTTPYSPSDELKRRYLDLPEEQRAALEEEWNRRRAEENIYESLLWKSPNPAAVALHKLDPRAPSPPNCPEDGDVDWVNIFTLGLGLPDSTGKFFHPNELGHITIASFAVETMMDLRAQVLGVDAPSCESTVDEFTCWQADGRKAYASVDRMNENYQDFCNNYVQQPVNTVGWSAEKTYHEGTPDEHTFSLKLTEDVADFDKTMCLDSFSRIINGCDGNDPENPMNWKFGGKWVRGYYTYEVTPKADYRPWPPIKQAYGSCEGWYHVFWSSYVIYGAGWSDYDWGQQTLLANAKSCVGGGVTLWRFKYLNPPENGYEWKADFNTPIWVRARCFDNNKVQFAAGGFSDGCGGNDW